MIIPSEMTCKILDLQMHYKDSNLSISIDSFYLAIDNTSFED